VFTLGLVVVVEQVSKQVALLAMEALEAAGVVEALAPLLQREWAALVTTLVKMELHHKEEMAAQIVEAVVVDVEITLLTQATVALA
jgi:hypothetical protein